MAFTAQLQFGDNKAKHYGSKSYLVSNFRYHTQRGHNGMRPDGIAMCERLSLTVALPDKGDKTLYEWYVSGDTKSGRILVELSSERVGEEDVCKEILFADAVCFAIKEEYDIAADRPRELTLDLMSGNVSQSDVTDEKPVTRNDAVPAIKGMVVKEDLSNPRASVNGRNCATLQHFAYECHRERNWEGYPYGSTMPVLMDLVVKVSQTATGKEFYENMDTNEPMVFTVLFDNTFAGKKVLDDYQNALIVRGYVVDIEEEFDKNPGSGGRHNMMLLRVKTLVSNICYNSNLCLEMTND